MDQERQLHFFCFKSALEISTRTPVEGGGGEPGKPPKQMKKRKRPFSEKGDCCQKGTLKNFSKKQKKAYYNNGKTLRFRVLNIRR